MSDAKIPEDIAAMPFEKALTELESVVARMEAGGQTLDQLMELFERGRLLTAHCRGKLSKLEQKISLLVKDDGDEGQWTDFDPGSGRRDDPPF